MIRKVIFRGYLIRALDPQSQLEETSHRFHVAHWARPFTRCMRCIHPLRGAEKSSVTARLQPLTRLYFQEFSICPPCEQIYWRGSHVERMLRRVARLQDSQEKPGAT